MFLQVSICPQGEGCLLLGGVPGPGGVPARGVGVPGPKGGVWSRGGLVETPPGRLFAAGGTHPTGMHFYFTLVNSLYRCIYEYWYICS